MSAVAVGSGGRFAITPARAVEDRRLGDAAFRVLAALGTYADKDGWCWPSTGTLAGRLGIARQAVQRSLKQLSAIGYIEVQRRRRKDGGHDRNRYRLLFDRALFQVSGTASDAAEPMQHGVASPCNVEGTTHATWEAPAYNDERTHKNDSVGSYEPTAGARPAEQRKQLYATGKAVFGKNTGSIVTSLLKHCDGDIEHAFRLLRLSAEATNPREYTFGILRGEHRAEDVLAETDRLYRELGVSL